MTVLKTRFKNLQICLYSAQSLQSSCFFGLSFSIPSLFPSSLFLGSLCYFHTRSVSLISSTPSFKFPYSLLYVALASNSFSPSRTPSCSLIFTPAHVLHLFLSLSLELVAISLIYFLHLLVQPLLCSPTCLSLVFPPLSHRPLYLSSFFMFAFISLSLHPNVSLSFPVWK